MLRTIITPNSEEIKIVIPEKYIGKPIEVVCFAIDEIERQTGKVTMGDFWGTISHETAELLRKETEKSRDEWDREF